MVLSFLVKRIIHQLLQISDVYGSTPLYLYHSHTTDHSNDHLLRHYAHLHNTKAF